MFAFVVPAGFCAKTSDRRLMLQAGTERYLVHVPAECGAGETAYIELAQQESDERAELEQRLRDREEERRLLSLRATELEMKPEQQQQQEVFVPRRPYTRSQARAARLAERLQRRV